MNGKNYGRTRKSLISRRAILEQLPAFAVLRAFSGLQGGLVAECKEPSPAAPSASTTPCAACAACTSRFCRYKAVGRVPPYRHVEMKEPS